VNSGEFCRDLAVYGGEVLLKDLPIEIQNGPAVQALVDEFYIKNGSQGRTRLGDTFFLAKNQNELIGCVRFCVENKTPLLRTMMIAPEFRRQGVGLRLLKKFAEYLDENKIKNTYCLPYSHLAEFYGMIGFQKVGSDQIPRFLKARMESYELSGSQNICMRRP
jgi:N-acetylglutamate synthase-like GNAT family acetyltransferase